VGFEYSYVMLKYKKIPLYVNLSTESCYSVFTALFSVMKDLESDNASMFLRKMYMYGYFTWRNIASRVFMNDPTWPSEKYD
jgi:hypothetical protein